MNVPGWSEDMMKSWTEAQQKYWSNLMSMSGSTEGSAASMPDWSGGMEKWWSMVTPQMPVQANELMSRVFEMGQVYTRLAEDAVAASSGSENKNVLEGWMSMMEKSFKDWSAQNGADFSNLGSSKHVVDGWQQVMDSMGMGVFNTMPTMANMQGSEVWQEQMQKMLGLSGLGGSIPQNSQDMLAKLTENYQSAMQGYMGAFSGQGVDSVQALRERMAQLSGEGASIDSLRELYDLWVDVSEEVYQKFAMSDRYQEVYGEMINSFVALKGGIDTVRETQLQTLRILTAADHDELLEKQYEAGRENEDLNNQVDELKKRVDTLEQPAPKVKTAPKKAAAKNPVAKKVAAKKPAPKAAPKAKPAEVAKKAEFKAAAPKAKAKGVAAKPKPAVKPDELTLIKGLGPKMQEKLIDAGIRTFDQLAALSDDQAQVLDKQLGARGRLVSDKWVIQAGNMSGNKLA
uniref:Poly(3-hydroxyalkanoate) polymerase subunit PhaE n=1 Tax=uncultured Thiotrichaceae bacterium TaxID=298394 RepID=A0A6S6TM71_9GAMM|nr:MAG: Unknown protein [uncultured Thiotrichaceae bacterium]